jgi:hypothetical protein
MEITYLAQSIESGEPVQSEKKDNENEGELQKDRISFFNKNDLSKLDIQNPIKKKRVCNGISKFYVKIAHIFATILTTINPVYVYKDENGNTINANIYNKNAIPKDVKPEIRYSNICDNRINALKRDLDLESVGEVNIHPNICSFNVAKPEETLDYQKHIGGTTVELETNSSNGATVETLNKTLEDEPGIPELMELYYDDMYDYETGKFTGMSDSSRELFEENLKYFYSVFTDGQAMPEHIKKFSDIKLREYHNMTECKGEKPLLDTIVKGNFSDELFKKYAENLKGMIKKAKENQDMLLDVLNKLFSYTVDKETNKKQIRINPKLTESSLQEVVLETRAIIVRLYLTCETDFTNGIKIYEAIVERTILETTKNQLKTLEKMADKLVAESDIPNPAETKELERIHGLNA